jgi:hypothetical protein
MSANISRHGLTSFGAANNGILNHSTVSIRSLMRARSVRFPILLSIPFTISLATDLDTITDELEREASVGIIHNCP